MATIQKPLANISVTGHWRILSYVWYKQIQILLLLHINITHTMQEFWYFRMSFHLCTGWSSFFFQLTPTHHSVLARERSHNNYWIENNLTENPAPDFCYPDEGYPSNIRLEQILFLLPHWSEFATDQWKGSCNFRPKMEREMKTSTIRKIFFSSIRITISTVYTFIQGQSEWPCNGTYYTSEQPDRSG